MIPVQQDHDGEQTLLTAKPTRYIAFHYYVLFLLAIVLAPLVYLHPWYFDLIPATALGPVDLREIITGLLLLLALYSLVRAELKRATTFYIITDNKIIRRDGILNRNTQMMPYTMLNRVDLNQSFGQRLLHIGTVLVDTGDDKMSIDHVAHPEKIQQLLSARIGRRAYIQQR
ncbi:MAG TPA: PH domain-containing protein [Thermoplasmata archaeon]|nr:PH domain-containing protein [Thermoplasmata archaeon]